MTLSLVGSLISVSVGTGVGFSAVFGKDFAVFGLLGGLKGKGEATRAEAHSYQQASSWRRFSRRSIDFSGVVIIRSLISTSLSLVGRM